MSVEYVKKRLERILLEHARQMQFVPKPKPSPAQLAFLKLQQCVYVIPCMELVKIGIAQDPAKRWRDLRIGNPLIEPIAYQSEAFRRKRALTIEAMAHRELRAYRVVGEWFHCSAEAAIAIVQHLESST